MLLKEPLLHFTVLGVLIFLMYGWIAPDGPADDELVVTQGQQQHLLTAFLKSWNRQPTQAEFDALVDTWVREELAYRESMELGLEANDTIIRRRLQQKLELLADDVVNIDEPTTEELERFLEENQTDYAQDPVYTFRHIFFSRDSRDRAAFSDARQMLQLMDDDKQKAKAEVAGDAFPLASRFDQEALRNISSALGSDFSDGLVDLRVGEWGGPVSSAYGAHLVLIESHTPARPLTLAEAGQAVRRDWAMQQQEQVIDLLYERLRERYTITIDSPPDTED
jgi:hypothetical protein